MSNKPFPISPKISVAGICHLLTKTETHHIISGGGSAISRLAESIESSLKASKHHLYTTRLPTFKELFQSNSQDVYEPFPNVTPTSGDSVVAILHSSGSTGLPRPVLYTQECLLSSFVNQREQA
jgi:acyl-coenzyme A synthetase/AMP-(fatty) acid ligase